MSSRSLVWQSLFAALALGLLLTLGVWQLRRLEWKESLIARLETRTRAAPVEIPPPSDWAGLAERITTIAMFGRTADSISPVR